MSMKKLLCTLIALVLVCSVAFAELSIVDITSQYEEMLEGKWTCVSGTNTASSVKGLHNSNGEFTYSVIDHKITASLDGKAYLLWGILGSFSWSGEISVSGDGKYLCVYDQLNDAMSIYKKIG